MTNEVEEQTEDQVEQPEPLASQGEKPEPTEKLGNLADACLEVHKSSADPKEARKNFRQLIQAAYNLGTGKGTDIKITPRTPRTTNALTFKPRPKPDAVKVAKKPKPADPKKVTHDDGRGKSKDKAKPAAKEKAAPAAKPKEPTAAEQQAKANADLEQF